MVTNDILQMIKEKTEISKTTIAEVLDNFFEIIKTAGEEGEKSLYKKEHFKITSRNPRTCRNPRTGEPVQVPGKRYLTWRTQLSVAEE